MARTNSQCRKCRRAGEKLFLKGEKCNSPKCPMIKRNFPPGVHGSKGQPRQTNYGRQLKEKQKAKRIYGLRERQFKGYFDKAFKKVGNTGELLFTALERRLDNVVYRLGWANSRNNARQIVSHGHIEINGRKSDIPSLAVKTGDVVAVRERSKKSPAFANLIEIPAKKELPGWLNLDQKELKAKVTSAPNLKESGMNIDWQMIVEFYSK